MMTLEAAKQFFELSDGASDADYNAYNYMVLTAHAKPEARARIPSVVHADGTGRIQIVRDKPIRSPTPISRRSAAASASRSR